MTRSGRWRTAAIGTLAAAALLTVATACGTHPATAASAPTKPFPEATAFYTPIDSANALNPRSAALVSALLDGSIPVINLGDYGSPVYVASSSTPHYELTVSQEGDDKWGDNVLAHVSVPIPKGATPSAGTDHKLVIVDPTTNQVFDLFGAHFSAGTWTVTWGGIYPLDGDGASQNASYGTGANQVKPFAALSRGTGSGLSTLLGLLTPQDVAGTTIDHALAFSSFLTCGPAQSAHYQAPATTTDGGRVSGLCINEGTRIRLDPSIDLARIPGISAAELAIGRALQKYGAYCNDSGGAGVAIAAAIATTPAGKQDYAHAKIAGNYVSLPHIPWDRLQVLSPA